jgi:hypothetical protein
MTLYQCVLLKTRGEVSTDETIESASLDEAVLQGRRMMAHRSHYDTFEIWEARRLRHVERNWVRARHGEPRH